MTTFRLKRSIVMGTLRFPHPGTHLNTPSNNPYYQPSNVHPKLPVKNYNPVEWEEYFEQLLYLEDVSQVQT